MAGRRQFLVAAAAALGFAPLIAWVTRPSAANASMSDDGVSFQRTDEEWRRTLTPAQYRVLRGHGTERAFSSPLDHEKRQGTFACAACGSPLFDASTKFDSGT